MARRKKYPKLPNGYGSIKYLGKGRRNPYAVHPPVTEFTLEGVPVTPKALCYVDDWMKGFAVLTAYHAGSYEPGMENNLTTDNGHEVNSLAQRILSDYNRTKSADSKISERLTFSQVYERFYEYKYERDKSRVYSKNTMQSTRAAFKNCKALHDRYFDSLRHEDLQNILDSCKLKKASVEIIVSLLHQMYKYAESFDLIDRDYSRNIKIHIPEDDEHGVPFTQEELSILWENKDDFTVEMIIIMCYSGYRISAYKNLEVNLSERYFRGGVKTATGKNRIVPIHSGIYHLVESRLKRQKELIVGPVGSFRSDMYAALKKIGIQKHTPHDCRHTFSALCEKYKVNENDRKRMLGHSFGSDITNGIYGHRSVEELREEIEKIRI